MSFSGPCIHLPINAPTAKTFLNRDAIYVPSFQFFLISQSNFFRFLLLFHKHLFKSSANLSSELSTAGNVKPALLCLLCMTAIPVWLGLRPTYSRKQPTCPSTGVEALNVYINLLPELFSLCPTWVVQVPIIWTLFAICYPYSVKEFLTPTLTFGFSFLVWPIPVRRMLRLITQSFLLDQCPQTISRYSQHFKMQTIIKWNNI